MARLITISVIEEQAYASRDLAGVQGETNATDVVITFDAGWDGLAKTMTWWNAHMDNPVKRILTADLLQDAAVDTRTYLTKVPGEPLELEGKCTLVVDGYLDDVRARTVQLQMEVACAPTAEDAGEPADPTPTQAEQLQVQIDAVMEDLQKAAQGAQYGEQAQEAAQASEDAAQRAEAAAALAQSVSSRPPVIGENGNWQLWDGESYEDSGKTSVGPQGEQGPQGPQGPAGTGSGDMLASVYDPQGRAQDVFQAIDTAVEGAVSDHNGDSQAHGDIRDLVSSAQSAAEQAASAAGVAQSAADTANANAAAAQTAADSKAPAYTYGTDDLEAGVTELTTGTLHFVYE